MKKKVVFVESQAGSNLAYSHFLKKWPLIGSTLMGTMLRDRGHDVKVYNENLTGPVVDDDSAMAALLEADFVGVSALTPSVMKAYTLAERLKKAGTKARMAIGGPHATFMPEEALRYFPCVVQGEGEGVIAELVESTQPVSGIVKTTPVANLNDLPTPDLSLIHNHEELWKPSLWKERYEVPLSTARGCPHDCHYCTVTKMYGRKCRTRSAENVYKDIMFYYDQGYRSFFFYDDNFTADRSRTQKLLEMIAPLKVRWNAQCRIDLAWLDPVSRRNVDKPLMSALRASGADVFYVGYETIDDTTASEWNKGYKGSDPLIKRMTQDTSILHDYGIWVHGMFVIGPQHGLDTFSSILRFALCNYIDSLQMSILTPFPGTQTLEQMKNELLFNRFPEDWRYFDGAHATFHHKKLGNKALQEAMLHYHRKYYHGAVHQLDRLRRLFFAPGGMYKKVVIGISSARKVRQLFRNWQAETALFIEEVERRGPQYLYPADKP